MADQNFMDLASKTASGITGTDYMMLVNNSEAYKALVNDVAEAILSKLTSKSFSGLKTTAKNVIGALNELNSKTIQQFTQAIASIDEIKASGVYCGQDLWGDNIWITCLAIFQSTSINSPGFIIGLGTSTDAVSSFNKIYYAVRTADGQWNKKIASI